MRTGPVSFGGGGGWGGGGAEVSFPNVVSIGLPENQVVLPEYYFLARKWQLEKF